MPRILQIGLVWCGCALAWFVLGSTVMVRSGEFSNSLTSEVQALWGAPIEQRPPTARFLGAHQHRELTPGLDPTGQPLQSSMELDEGGDVPVPIARSSIDADLALQHRRKGLLWFPTYSLNFRGVYQFENTTSEDHQILFTLPIDAANADLDGFSIKHEDGSAIVWEVDRTGAHWKATVKHGERVGFVIAFRTRGTTSWKYLVAFGNGRVRDFHLAVTTNFANVDFPSGSLSPTAHAPTPSGWRGEWQFEGLISSAPVGLILPHKLNPGPLAARITYFAPLSLLFFFFVVALLAHVQDKHLHPAHYFFLGCAFFAFHLLFAYLADHLPLSWVFVLSSAVSVFLVVSYVRLFAGWRFALREVGLAQLIYLVLFSLSFLSEGYTGLAITCGAIATLFVMMQVTGRQLPLWGALAQPRRPRGSPEKEPASGLYGK